MSTVKYHVNPDTLRPGQCRAVYKCAFQTEEGQNPPHFDTKEEAQKAVELMAFMEGQKLIASVKRNSKMTPPRNPVYTNTTPDEEFQKVIDAANARKAKTSVNTGAAKTKSDDSTTELDRIEAQFANAGKIVSQWNALNSPVAQGFPDDTEIVGRYLDIDGVERNIYVTDEDGPVDADTTVYQAKNLIHNRVVVDGADFERIRDGVQIGEPYSFRVQVGNEMDADQARHLAGLVGYEYAKTGGEKGNDYYQDAPNSIVFYADTTKGGAYNNLTKMIEQLPDTITNGSPKRKTDRTGPVGSQKVAGMGDLGYIEVYADHVHKN